ncbi:MAG TPA: ACP phosphodiesterase [Chryseosolibacter sp.]|nr:ACP phosphodiesterase [Chryseosolibacter sp.]
MNFLAHAYLSGDQTKIMIGNFIGDFVKGREGLKKFDPMIAKGISLHRAIDEFTDDHVVVTESKKRLRPKYRHYAGVIVDVFYDHFLASEWHLYHRKPLNDYAQWVYHTIQASEEELPPGVKYMLPYMMNGDWLYNYRELSGIGRALSGMSRRTPYESKMDEAVADLEKDYALYKAEFDLFFPQLMKHCEHWLHPRH